MFSLGAQKKDKKAFFSKSLDLMILKQGAIRRGGWTYGGVAQTGHGPAFCPVLPTRGGLLSFLTIGKLPVVSGRVSQVSFKLDTKCKLKL